MRTHVAALDGIRAVALIGVLLFHQPFVAFSGGFLGVSTFFTLSGFLIGGLLFDELERRGTVRLGEFYLRRARRLLPAAVATIAAVTVVWWLRAAPLAPGEVLASLFYAQNWQLIATERGYSALFVEPSPLHHLWSLAIEEQFYLVVPLLFAGAARRGGRPRRLLVVLATLAVAGVASSAFGRRAVDVSYFSTLARAPELLAGVALARVVRVRRGVAAQLGGVPAVLVDVALLAAMLALFVRVSYSTAGLVPWITLLNAAVAVLVIVRALGTGLLPAVLAVAPLAWLGRASYAIYLVHWPVFVALRPGTLGLHGTALFAWRMVWVLVLSIPLHLLIENPIRFRPLRPRQLGYVLLPALVLALVVTALRPAPRVVVDEAAVRSEYLAVLAGAGRAGGDRGPARRHDDDAGAGPAPPATAPVRVAERVLFVGDSTSWTLSSGVKPLVDGRGGEAVNLSAVGCGIGGSTPIRYLGEERSGTPECDRWLVDVEQALVTFAPDVVVVAAAYADLSERRIDGDWRQIGDPGYDAWLAARIEAFAALLTGTGTPVVWLTSPNIDLTHTSTGIGAVDPAFVDRYNELLTGVAGGVPGVTVADWGARLQAWPGGEFAPGLRADGIHIVTEDHPELAEWLLAEIDVAVAAAAARS